MQPETPDQFATLSPFLQVDVLQEYGVCLDLARYSGAHKVGLFALGSYYVEVWVNSQTGYITKTSPFAALKRLDPYLPLVNIQTALNRL